jgi:hypothetical protein
VLTREAETLKRELRELIWLHRPELLEETGCGPLPRQPSVVRLCRPTDRLELAA